MEVDDRGFWRVNRNRQNPPTPASRLFNAIGQFLVSQLTYLGYFTQSMIEVFFTLPFQIWRDVFRGTREPFKHRPLPKGHIRLLRLERWLPFRQVRASLIVVHLIDVPVYQGISYTWGTDKPTHEILIDGQPFKTTASTYGALHACSSVLGPATVWTDYVCIDQTNLLEKNVQVAMMNYIYQQST